jgi:predicted Zn-dependent protease
MILQEKDIKGLLENIIAQNPGKGLDVGISSSETGSTRFANNAITTNGVYNRLNLYVAVTKGKKRGIALVNELSAEKINEAVARADALADVAPENPELMPSLGPQAYPKIPPVYFQKSADFSPGERADAILAVIEKAKKNNVTAAGFFETGSYASGSLNSKGLYYFLTASRAYYSNTIRSEGGSGWASADDENVEKVSIEGLSDRALRKALDSRKAGPLAPGKYTVILEPAAAADMVWFLLYNFSAREADEGRTFLSLGEGKNRLGETLVSPKITIFSDPAFPEIPAFPIGEDGLPQSKTAWIEKGVVKNLSYTRFWAQKMDKEPVGFPPNIIMEGEDHTMEELIKSTKRGVLVSRFWYIRDLNPMILLLTGLTRDGTFLIENGKVSHPVNNFRFNESPVNMLKNVEMMSRPVRVVGGEVGQSAYVPALKVKDFNFSSVSDAV